MTGGNENSLTLTHYMIEGSDRGYRSAAEASRFLGSREDRRITAHTQTYRVGDEVEVRAFGAWRRGKVVSLRRVKVIVHFRRNKRGAISARAFYGSDVRPRPREGRWVQS